MGLGLSGVAILMVVSLVAACGSASAPGGSEEAVVRNGDVELRWFLDLPEGEGPFAAVVYGPGSGSVDAASESTIRFARGLNELGMAVARYDKRGTGGSGGDLVEVSTGNSEQTIALLASDMQAVLDALLRDPRIDRERVGLFGASQAAWYMPVVAAATPDVRFMIVITGGVAPVGFQNTYEFLTRIEGLPPAEAEAELGRLRDFDGPRGFRAIPILGELGVPLLYLMGGDDRGVPLDGNLAAMRELAANGARLDVQVYDGAGHVLPDVDIWPHVARWLASAGIVVP